MKAEFAAVEYDRAPYQPSNGTEGDCFMSAWCFRCERERAVMSGGADPSEGCDILARTFALRCDDPDYPKEWTYAEGAPGLPLDTARCSAFVPMGGEVPEPLDPNAVIRPLL